MKKIIMVFLAFSLIYFMVACENNSSEKKEIDNSISTLEGDFIFLEDDEWPNNEYTAGLFAPEAGVISEGWIDPDNKFLYILFSEISEIEAKNYIQDLNADGFSLVENISEEVNNGNYISNATILTKDDTFLSLAYSNEQLGIYIKKINQASSEN